MILQSVGDCEPYARMNTSMGEKVIAPCGAIANSMFNGCKSFLINQFYFVFCHYFYNLSI